jgi:hypothetical protein
VADAKYTPFDDEWTIDDAWHYLIRSLERAEHGARVDLLTAFRRGRLPVRCNGHLMPADMWEDLTLKIDDGHIIVWWLCDPVSIFPFEWLKNGDPSANCYTVSRRDVQMLCQPQAESRETAHPEQHEVQQQVDPWARPAKDVEQPPANASKVTQLVWAYGELLRAGELTGLRGKVLRTTVCLKVGPKFTASDRTFAEALRQYRKSPPA